MPLAVGEKLGPYEISAPIGAGGMGEVYRAHDPRLRRDVAIKVSTAQFTERFEREARAIAALNHPNICTLYDVGPNYLVMELIVGTPLQGPLPPDQAIRYGVQICDALDAAHKKNITHRDLKPGNILVTASGVKLLDFGLAKVDPIVSAADATQTMPLTEAGGVFGTPAYMSPEQARGDPLDARTDIFSFGAVLYEMLSGRRAFAHASSVEILSAILRDEPRPLDAASNLSAIVTRCLRKRPEDRFRSMSDVRAALEAASIDRPAGKRSSVAVLPFTNTSADKENECFGDGLAEEILNLLAKIPGLKVIARTSSFAFRGKEQDITTIAEALRVEHVLEGSVRRVGNRIRVTAQLIHAADGAHLWAERYDRDLTDVFAIQDEIGQAISEALKLRLAPRVQAVNVEAWQHCLKGEYYRLRYTPEGLAKAKEHLEQAIAIDPNYARAYSKLASYYYMLAILNMKPATDMVPLAKAAAAKALALEPANGEAHSLPAVIAAVFDHDWKAAAHHHGKALAAEVVSPYSRYAYASYYLLPWGRTAEALEQSHSALDGDPLSVPLHFGLAFGYYCAKQYNESIECARRALEIDPNAYFVWHTMGDAQLAAGHTDDAIASLKRSVDLAPWYNIAVGALASAYRCAGDQERAREWSQRLALSHGHSVGMARYYATCDEPDAMFEALEGAYGQRDAFLLWLQRWTSFDPYQADPRFQSLLKRMHFVERDGLA